MGVYGWPSCVDSHADVTILQEYVDNLQKIYEENLEAVKSLQRTLTDEILPSLVDELDLDEEEQRKAEEWLQDTPSVFRTFKRHKFTTSFALEALRTTLIWRIRSLPPLDIAPPSPFIHCLPAKCWDPFDRPIVVVQLAGISETGHDLRPVLLRNTELLRLNLAALNKSKGTAPILQYVALLDIKGVSLSSVAKIDLLAWCMSEMLPHFPGMLAAVFVINFGWTHSGLWNLSRRTLPRAALSRVFFPTEQELLEYFSASSLPQDYGGELPTLIDLPDPLHLHISRSAANHKDTVINPETPVCPTEVKESTSTQEAISPFSLLNPYFGYPAMISDAAAPTLYYGRRRKRDLFRTLLRLFWMRWRRHLTASFFCLLVFLTIAVLRKVTWMRRWRWPISSASALLGVILQLPPSVGAGTLWNVAIPIN
ncbi:unnamed protein product [Somion occarium]|uniref:CRAL-TRIO domain-containing protein n=1 Tax=Somion occarium TaxID=3059160 RepID=A0ABP1DEF2_9APHY